VNGRFALDTNVVIAFLAREQAIVERATAAEIVLIPTPVLGELYHGAYRSARPAANVARITSLIESHTVVAVDEETAQRYGFIKDALQRKGTPIPDNDIWIAALAQQHATAVVTRDTHFDTIDGLEIVRW
jgi:tRNA(fMet)-specific endonuclease VapC